jgi:hypothetical protein
MELKSWVMGAVVAAVIGTAVGQVGTSPASAAAASPLDAGVDGAVVAVVTAQWTASVATSDDEVGPRSVRPSSVISCQLKVNDPHASGHVPGTVNVTAKVTCSSAVTALSTNLKLYQNNFNVAGSFNSNTGQKSLSSQLDANCVTDVWSASGQSTVVFPAGYSPPTGIMNASSPHSWVVTCPH